MVAKASSFKPVMPIQLDRSFTYRLHLLAKVSDHESHKSYLDEVGLSLSEARCLATVGTFEPMSVMDLADKGNLNKGQASRAAQILVDKGLIRKKEHPSDGRGVTLGLTAAGKKLWDKTMTLIDARNRHIVSCLNKDEQATLSRLLDRLLQHNIGE